MSSFYIEEQDFVTGASGVGSFFIEEQSVIVGSSSIGQIEVLVTNSPGTGISTGGGGSTDIEDLSGDIVDGTGSYRLILFSNGTVRAIPVNTPDPVPPTGLATAPTLSSVLLTWTAATAPTTGRTYVVLRDGVEIATTTSTSYRDRGITAGSTYSYRLITQDTYGQRSAQTSAVSAFINPASNVAPVTTVTSWPPVIPTNGKALLRVCAADVDAQSLTLALSVDTGTITATDDPSIWIYTPAGG